MYIYVEISSGAMTQNEASKGRRYYPQRQALAAPAGRAGRTHAFETRDGIYLMAARIGVQTGS